MNTSDHGRFDDKSGNDAAQGGLSADDGRRMANQQYVERMIEELHQLDNRRILLMRFIQNNPMYATLPDAEQRRLHRQLKIMELYSDVLMERRAFAEGVE